MPYIVSELLLRETCCTSEKTVERNGINFCENRERLINYLAEWIDEDHRVDREEIEQQIERIIESGAIRSPFDKCRCIKMIYIDDDEDDFKEQNVFERHEDEIILQDMIKPSYYACFIINSESKAVASATIQVRDQLWKFLQDTIKAYGANLGIPSINYVIQNGGLNIEPSKFVFKVTKIDPLAITV